jgi:quinohemoprotein ethanol dehydrogenase
MKILAVTLIVGVDCHATGTGDSLTDEGSGADWASYGRTYSEEHYSPLSQITAANVSQLGLAWSLELPDVHNGATVPLAVDGVVYFAVDQSIVRAVDAVSGKLLWVYDPKAAESAGHKLRKGWGVHGIGYWNGKIYVGTTDGRLIAIDAKTGRPVWSALTVAKNDSRYITGVPRLFDDMAIIGHAGSEFAGVRGYVTAYDAGTGRQRWRFYTVPSGPGERNDPAMQMAARSWSGDGWKNGGGGVVWNAITFDPEQNLIYIGTSNGSPWNQGIRSPGGGDNLFCNSIVALDAQTGRYRWHYQTTPGDTWDYDSTNDIELATLLIEGQPRKVIIHAPKNGFFYVIDRTNGKLISAAPFSKVTWAERIDPQSGRPVEAADARYYQTKPQLIWPSPVGAANWTPMAFSPMTGLAYFQELEMPGFLDNRGIDARNWMRPHDQVSIGVQISASDAPAGGGNSSLLAWDPVSQRARWKVQTPGAWNGGVMATAGNLVFHGNATGEFVAHDAENGKRLWSFDARMGIAGAPISFLAAGRQYVAVVAGWGGAGAGTLGSLGAQFGWVSRVHSHRLLAFVLGGAGQLPTTLPGPQIVQAVDDPTIRLDSAKVELGADLYSHTCISCHGAGVVAAGFAPDLRASSIPLSAGDFKAVVQGGSLLERGMPRFEELSNTELENLRQFIRASARNPDIGPKHLFSR